MSGAFRLAMEPAPPDPIAAQQAQMDALLTALGGDHG